jgi:hypothetical protein
MKSLLKCGKHCFTSKLEYIIPEATFGPISTVMEIQIFQMWLDLEVIYLFTGKCKVRWKKCVHFIFINVPKWPPSIWVHILTSSTTESVTLRRTAASLTCLAASKIRYSSSSLVPSLRSYAIFFTYPLTYKI